MEKDGNNNVKLQGCQARKDVPEYKPIYEGKTVTIRRLTVEDASIIAAWNKEPFFYYYRPYMKNLFSSIEEITRRIVFHKALSPPLEIEALVLHRPTGEPIGLVSLSSIDSDNLKAEFSLCFRRGRNTRCVAETLFFVFHEVFQVLGFRKIFFYVTADNKEVLRTLQNYNVISEGCLVEEVCTENGKATDIYRFCILGRDWAQSRLREKLNRINMRIR